MLCNGPGLNRRGAEAMREFWRRFKLSGARLKAVAMDMSGAYACSVRAHAPHAILTFDRFHVMKLMNERSFRAFRDSSAIPTLGIHVLSDPICSLLCTNRRLPLPALEARQKKEASDTTL